MSEYSLYGVKIEFLGTNSKRKGMSSSAQDPFYIVKEEIQDSVSLFLLAEINISFSDQCLVNYAVNFFYVKF